MLPGLEGTETDQGDEQCGGAGEDHDGGRECLTEDLQLPDREAGEEEDAAKDGGRPPESKGHPETPLWMWRDVTAAPVEVCIDGSQHDVRHVERSERSLLEECLELVPRSADASQTGRGG